MSNNAETVSCSAPTCNTTVASVTLEEKRECCGLKGASQAACLYVHVFAFSRSIRFHVEHRRHGCCRDTWDEVQVSA